MNQKLFGIIGQILFLSCLGKCEVQSGATLRCWKDSIYIEFSERFLSDQRIEVTDAKQLHFSGVSECFSNAESGGGYSMTLFPPFKNCGTKVKVSSDKYAYTNEVVFETETSTTRIFKFQCDYDRKYIVSSDLSLTPVLETLNFVTARGEFGVGMGLYQRSDFNSKSMFSARPTILVGTPVYVSVDVTDTFGMKEIVSTIETCYATDDKNHAIQKLYHHLIVNRCSSPNDDTVQIISNGNSMKARFRFAMFQWKSNVEYFYLHCEIKVCNQTEERCSGVGPVCNGVSDAVDATSRRRRDLGTNEDKISGNKGIITYGPVAIKDKGVEEDFGTGTYEMVYEEIEKDQKFLQIYIFTSIAAVILVVVIIVLIIVLVRKRRAINKQRLESENRSNGSI
uniref:uromodulin-like n=1 Tax=Styela clava TaxID=7725 RepID=UPI00193A8F17|nr:uromodulin-like [Styela clava]